MKKNMIIFALIAILISACSSGTPSSAPARTGVPQVVSAGATVSAQPVSARSAPNVMVISAPATIATAVASAPTTTTAPEVMYFPTVTFSSNVACYMGPDKNYYKVANFSSGQSTQVQGHSDDAKWLNVLTLAPTIAQTCWVPLTSVKHFASANALQVIKAVPLPDAVTLAVARKKYTCGVDPNNGVELGWAPSATDSRFAVKRTDDHVTMVYGGEYIDHKTPAAKIQYLLTYIVQPVNSVGISQFTAVTSATICGIQYNLLMSTVGQ